MKIEEVVPDLLDRKETLALSGVVRPYSDREESARIEAEALSADGIYITPSESPVAYGDETRQQVLEKLLPKPQKWIYFYGGWNNGMTLHANICASVLLSGIPLSQLKVKNVREGLQSPDRPPIFYDYLSDYDPEGVVISGWKDMVHRKGLKLSSEEYEELTISDLLLKIGGAPTRWNLMVTTPNGTEHLLPPTTSAPFPRCEYGNGFIACYRKSIFEGFEKPICNSTGSRAIDSIALANLLVRLRHDDPATVKEKYIEDAGRRRGEMIKKGAKPPYTMGEAERYASFFIKTQNPIVEDIVKVVSKYPEIDAIQYALIVTSDRSLPTAIYKIPPVRPYCWVKTPQKGWELSV